MGILNKLAVFRANLVRTDIDWHNWNSREFAEQLQQWTERNPINFVKRSPEQPKGERFYQARQ